MMEAHALPIPALDALPPVEPGGRCLQLADLAPTCVSIAVELAECPLFVRDLLQLGPGSVVPLQIAPGGPVTFRAGGVAIAVGETVVQGRRLWVRVLHHTTPEVRQDA
jgi:flagellar motor switch/type III secretory pathway protein FliN